MTEQPTVRPLVTWATFVVTLFSATSVAHANEDQFFVGNEAAMVGGAVVATVDDGSALYYNPAGLAKIERDTIDVSASAYALRLYIANNYIQTTTGESADTKELEFVTVPTQVAYSRRLAEGLVLGLGYFSARGGDTFFQERLEFDAAGREATAALDSREASQEFLVVAGLGIRANDWLRFGVTLQGTYENVTTAFAGFGGVNDGSGTQKALLISELASFERVGAEFGAGVQIDVSRSLTVAASFRSPAVHILQSETRSVDVLIGERESDLLSATASPNDADREFLGFLTYGRYHVGAAYRHARSVFRIEGDFQPGLTNPETSVERSFAWNIRGGFTQRVGSSLTLGGGLFTDQRSRPDRSSFYGGTLGIEFSNEHLLANREGADSLVFSSTFAFRYAYGTGETSIIVVDPDAAITEFFGAGATGAITTHEFGLHLGSSLKF